MSLSVLELCAGGGGQALGLEMAGFQHAAAVEYEGQFCQTLRLNRPEWTVLHKDLREINGTDFRGIDLLAAGVPCPPFSVAGKQLGPDDERDMFPSALEIVAKAKPRAVLFENVQGLAGAKFEDYRRSLIHALERLGYFATWCIVQASDHGVPQLPPRFLLIVLREQDFRLFIGHHLCQNRLLLEKLWGISLGEIPFCRALHEFTCSSRVSAHRS